MTDYCPVCRGEKRIRLPLMHELSVTDFNPDDYSQPIARESFRDYDCPECVLTIKPEHFKAGKVLTFMEAAQMSEPVKQHWRDYATKHMARMIAEKLIDDGMIEFTKLEPDVYHDEGLQASIYVALPKHWEPIEERIAERQKDVADEVARESKRLIDNWGSHYGWRDISKADACREIDDAVRHVKAKRAKK